MAVLPDSPAVRRLVADLASGRPPSGPEAEIAGTLAKLVATGLAVATGDEAGPRVRRSRARVHLDAPAPLTAAARDLLVQAGVGTTGRADDATMALVWGEGELRRSRLDHWVRTDRPHLVVIDRGQELTVGPFTVPGVTACLRCLDAHAAEADPRRALVVEQVAATPALRAESGDPVLRGLALAWAVSDLGAAAEGRRPSTWSATVRLQTPLPPVVSRWRRHAHCGCTWAEGVGQVS